MSAWPPGVCASRGVGWGGSTAQRSKVRAAHVFRAGRQGAATQQLAGQGSRHSPGALTLAGELDLDGVHVLANAPARGWGGGGNQGQYSACSPMQARRCAELASPALKPGARLASLARTLRLLATPWCRLRWLGASRAAGCWPAAGWGAGFGWHSAPPGAAPPPAPPRTGCAPPPASRAHLMLLLTPTRPAFTFSGYTPSLGCMYSTCGGRRRRRRWLGARARAPAPASLLLLHAAARTRRPPGRARLALPRTLPSGNTR